MKISDRFTDYGLIGGFFWLLFSISGFLLSQGDGDVALIDVAPLIQQINQISASAFPSIAALLGALAIIVIFTTGLLLDLLSSAFYSSTESGTFIANLRRNKQWLQKLIDNNREYVQDDLEVMFNTPQEYIGGFKLFMSLWSTHYRRERIRIFTNHTAVRNAYRRFQDFLLSYVLLTSSGEKNELLSTQISLWNLARAIAMAMVLGGVANSLAIFARGVFTSWFGSLVFLVLQLVLSLGSIGVARSAYGRVCSTLFANAYIITSGASSQAPARTSPNSPT